MLLLKKMLILQSPLRKAELTVVTFGDMMRVPGSAESLLDAKSEGADVRMVYSIDDAVALAEKKPELEVVFFRDRF